MRIILQKVLSKFETKFPTMGKKKNQFHHLRKDYGIGQLKESDLHKNPLKLFETWLHQALDANLDEPYAMNLATVNQYNNPSSRIVLLRSFDKNGFIFYTNYLSHKGQDLAANPNACVNFFWPALEKQVRIEGKVVKVKKAVSDAYFKGRPRESQIGVWASHQSSILKNRAELEQTVENLTEKFKHKPIPRPPYWGGYCLKPALFEFWQGRLNRLHDRFIYKKISSGNWKTFRISP